MHKKHWILAGLILLLSSSTLLAQYHEYDEWEENYTVQALLGVMKIDELEFDIKGSTEDEKADLSSIPQIGGAWATLPYGDRLQVGLETSLLLGWRSKDVTVTSTRSGLRVKVSTTVWTVELAGGPYVNIFLDKRKFVRLYGAAGPLLMYADYSTDDDDDDDSEEEDDDSNDFDDNSDSAFGYGLYARTGIEFRVHERGMVGIGVRVLYAKLDFSDVNVSGETDLKGIAGFVSYTAGF